MPLVKVRFNPPPLTDRAYRYRAVKQSPEGPKRCFLCGSTKGLMVGHLDGHEENTDPENLVWNCRSCNSHHGNALKKAHMGRRTRQFNPTKAGGASNLGEWVQAVGAIRPHLPYQGRGTRGGGLSSDMKVSEAVAMIRATPAHKRADFAAELRRRGAGRKAGSSDVPF